MGSTFPRPTGSNCPDPRGQDPPGYFFFAAFLVLFLAADFFAAAFFGAAFLAPAAAPFGAPNTRS